MMRGIIFRVRMWRVRRMRARARRANKRAKEEHRNENWRYAHALGYLQEQLLRKARRLEIKAVNGRVPR